MTLSVLPQIPAAVPESDRLFSAYMQALLVAQTTRLKSDWFLAAEAFDRFADALIAEGE